jgi:hypothetical protein
LSLAIILIIDLIYYTWWTYQSLGFRDDWMVRKLFF